MAVLALDEFQQVSAIPVMKTMIEQSRSSGLSLVLAHQSPDQVDEGIFNMITGNFAVQITGNLGADAAEKLAVAWNPTTTKTFKGIIATQPKHGFVGRVREKMIRFQTRIDPASGQTCRSNITDEEWRDFVKSERKSCNRSE